MNMSKTEEEKEGREKAKENKEAYTIKATHFGIESYFRSPKVKHLREIVILKLFPPNTGHCGL